MMGRALSRALCLLSVSAAVGSCLGDPISLDTAKTGDDASVEHKPNDATGGDAADTADTPDAANSADAPHDAPEAESNGSCTKNCLGGDCIAGKCQPVLIAPWSPDNQLPTSLAVDPAPNGGVFFTTYLGAEVKRAEKDGSGVTTVASFLWMHLALDIALDGERLYVTTYTADGPSPVYSMKQDGSDRFALGDTWFWGPWLLSFDSGYVYWANRFDSAFVTRAPKAGGPSEIVYQPAPPDDAGNAANGGWVVRVDGQAVYWAAGGKISKRDSNGKLTELVTDVAVDMALDATYVYWANVTTIRRIKKDGTGSIEDLASASSMGRMAMDGGYLYWTEFGTPPAKNGSLRRTKLDGSKATETLVSGLDGAGGVAFDASAVYFTEQQAGLVWKLAK